MTTRTLTGTLDELRGELSPASISDLEKLIEQAQAMEGGRRGTTYHYTGGRWVADRAPWRVRCTAHRPRDGRPCRAWAMHGQQVCVAHGGAARQNRWAAWRRLETMKIEAAYARVVGP